jgi:signal transduction histidine kinase
MQEQQWVSADIVIVDDDLIYLKVIYHLLSAAGHRVRSALSGEIALELVELQIPDIVLTDVRMPGMDGYEVCRRLKADPRRKDIPVIFMSGAGEIKDKLSGLNAGGVDYILKPVDRVELLIRIQTHVKLHSLQQSLETAYAGIEQKVQLRTEELQRAIEALRLSEKRLQDIAGFNDTLISSSPYGMLLYDDTGQCIRVNAAAIAILGAPEQQLLAQNYHMLEPWKKTGLYDMACSAVAGGAVQSRTLPFVAAVGEPIELELQAIALQVNTRAHLLLNFVDVTDHIRVRKKLEENSKELIRSNAELEQFAYVASHDLQEPLRVVVSYLQFLQSQYSQNLDEKGNEFVTRGIEATRRMQTMIRSLLMYSRIATRSASFVACESAAIVDNVLLGLQKAINDPKAVVTRENLPTIVADEVQMERLFQNLIANAIKFCDKGEPRVHVSACRQNDEWVFSVRDNGLGIEEQYFERIFEIFQRLHGWAKYEGAGIGLAACKKIVERHGGRIWVESVVGKGSVFRFTLGTNASIP